MYLNDVCTIPTNLSGDPAMSVPFGAGDDGLPVGVQVLAPALGEAPHVPGGRGARGGRAGADGGDVVSEPLIVTSDATGDRWEVVIGLEVHSELATATKMFCGAPNAFGDEPNTNIDPVTPRAARLAAGAQRAGGRAGHPGRAWPCTATVRPSIFARKNYFYPDMPKDYQISQYDEPINVDGWLELPDGTRVGIERAHLEEDTGKSTPPGRRRAHPRRRVTRSSTTTAPACRWSRSSGEPDIRSADEARAYVSELRAILVAIGASDGKMEEGSMRVDANVSVRPVGPTELGTALRDQERQLAALARSGHRVRGAPPGRRARGGRAGPPGDPPLGRGRRAAPAPVRSKEEADDYRYFLEPDLVRARPVAEWIARDRAPTLPVLPADAPGPAGRRRPASTPADGGHPRRPRPRRPGPRPPSRPAPTRAGCSTHVEHNLAVDGAADARPGPLRRAGRASRSTGELTATQAKTVLAEMVDTGASRPRPSPRPTGFEAMDAVRPRRPSSTAIIADNPDDWAASSPATTRSARS